mmetsp:Transcript_53542/g.116724  ORF Transcript_53542/g.116724 Transcript_53542/m.116724 type:complete len:208 (-) Transcript_53542:538-1161(-)
MWRSSLRALRIAAPAAASSGERRSAALSVFWACSMSLASTSACARSTYASMQSASRLIASLVVRSAASQRPKLRSALTRPSAARRAPVRVSALAKKDLASAPSLLAMAASPSSCQSRSCVAERRSSRSALASAFRQPCSRDSTALSNSPASINALALRLCALTLLGSISSAASQSLTQLTKSPSIRCVAARFSRNVGTRGHRFTALV